MHRRRPTPTDATDDTGPPSTEPTEPTEPTDRPMPTTTVEQVIDDSNEIGDVVNVGDGKEPRSYDEFVAAALSDVQAFWRAAYPQVYGQPFEELEGGIYAAYPNRDDIPGCGEPTHVVRGGGAVRRLLLHARRLHGLRRRRPQPARRARRELRAVDHGRRARPRVRPRDPVPHRRSRAGVSRRSSPSSRPTASPGRG